MFMEASDQEKLAIMTWIRKLLTAEDESMVYRVLTILTETELRKMVIHVLSCKVPPQNNSSDIWRHCRLEAAWIIVNLGFFEYKIVWELIGGDNAEN